MTSPAHSALAYFLTKHYFGETSAQVLRTLFNYDQATLRALKFHLTGIRYADIKKSLLDLVKHQLVDYVKTVKNSNQQYVYSLTPQRIFTFFRVSRYIHMIELKEGAMAAKLLSIISKKALIDREQLTRILVAEFRAVKVDPDGDEISTQVIELLEKLISKKYLGQTCKNICINFGRFDLDHRNDLIVNTLSDFYNNHSKIKLIARTILDLSRENTREDDETYMEMTITPSVPLLDILQQLAPNDSTNARILSSYLTELISDKAFRFFIHCGRHPVKDCPLYAINIGLVLDHLVKEHLCSVITTRFGPKCCRVFRVLLQRGPLLLKQIEEMIMLPARDVREYSYMLIKEGFIRNRQVPKTPDNAPGKSVFIMSVELEQVVFQITDLCCNALSNLLMRHDYELRRNESLLSRWKKAKELLESGDQTEGGDKPELTLDDWAQYFNSHELSQLDRVRCILDKILLAKIQVDETLFLLHNWTKLRPNMEKEISV